MFYYFLGMYLCTAIKSQFKAAQINIFKLTTYMHCIMFNQQYSTVLTQCLHYASVGFLLLEKTVFQFL